VRRVIAKRINEIFPDSLFNIPVSTRHKRKLWSKLSYLQKEDILKKLKEESNNKMR